MPDTSVETTVKEPTRDVIDNGNDLEKNSSLADIFSKIADGKGDGKSAREVIEEIAKEPEHTEPEKTEPEKTEPEVKEEPTDLEKQLNKSQEKKESDEIVRGEPEKKIEPEKKEAKPEEKAKPEDEVPEDQLQPLPHDKPLTVKRIKTLLTRIDKVTQSEANTKKELEARDLKLKELQTELEKVKTVDPTTNDQIKTQLDELAMFRRRYELEKDPEVKTKFDTRIESSEESIVKTLKDRQAGDGLLNLIKQEGGWNKFSKSSLAVTLTDGTNTTAAKLADQIIQSLPLGSRQEIEAAAIEQIQTARDRDRYFKEQQQNAVKYFKEKDEAQIKQKEIYDNQVKTARENIDKWVKETEEKTDWLKERAIPETATAAQKKEIEDDNKYSAQLRTLLRKSLAVKTFEDAIQINLDSVKYYQERRQNQKLLAELATVKAELAKKATEIDKFRGASRTVSKGGKIGQNGDPASTNSGSVKKFTSLEDTLNALASGQVSRSEILTNIPDEE
jgi:hypothetical protein